MGNMSMTSVDKLIVHPDNPRVGNIDLIVESIRRNGWYGTVVAQRSTRNVLAGNHRLMAAREVGIEEVPVYWVDVDDATATRILLADNRTADVATYDTQSLVSLLSAVRDDDNLLGTGWDDDDIADLLMSVTTINPDLDALADEWKDDQDAHHDWDDTRRTVTLNLEATLAREFETYIDTIGSHDAAISAFLEGVRA